MDIKKIVLTVVVFGSFVAYSIHEREEAQEAVNVVRTSQEQESLNPQSFVTPTSESATQPPQNFQSGGMMKGQQMMGMYKDGTYIGSTEDVFYGDIQVRATIQRGRIVDIEFLNYPADRATSVQINEAMMPILRQEAITAQSADVDIVSGATDSSKGFRRSLANALAQAQ